MILKSPDYQNLSIIVGEKPVPGAFYSPRTTDSLWVIANKAYGSGTLKWVNLINKSEWNIANCAYRAKSGSCSSPHVDATLARGQSSFADGAWLALCQADAQPWAKTLGCNFPILWIPTPVAEEPEDLAPDVIGGKDEHGCIPGAGQSWCESKQRCIAHGETCEEATEPQKRKGRKRPVWPWIVGAGIIGVGAYLLLRKKKKP